MSFRTVFHQIYKKQLVEVAASHVDFVRAVDASFKQALIDVNAATELEDKLAILTETVTNAFPLDLLDTWLAESQTLVEAKTTQKITQPISSSAPTTSTTTSNVPSITAPILAEQSIKSESDDEEHAPRRYKAYKLPPNVPMFMADGRTCDEWFFVFENALSSNSILYGVILPILSTLL